MEEFTLESLKPMCLLTWEGYVKFSNIDNPKYKNNVWVAVIKAISVVFGFTPEERIIAHDLLDRDIIWIGAKKSYVSSFVYLFQKDDRLGEKYGILETVMGRIFYFKELDYKKPITSEVGKALLSYNKRIREKTFDEYLTFISRFYPPLNENFKWYEKFW